MRFGVFLLSGRFPGQDDATALQRTLRAADAAEDAGFDDAWFAEHHFMPYGVCPSAITLASHVLGRNRRLSVGTAVSVLPTTHPVALAEQTALLDQVSGGRFRLGVGRGGPWVDLEVFGTGLDRHEQEGFGEGVDLLLRALSDSTVASDTDRFRFRAVPVVPRPATLPHPPVVVACTSPATVRLAAARGLPMLLGMHVGDADKAEMVELYRSAGGPDRSDHVSVVVAQVAESRRDAEQLLMTTLPPFLEAGFRAHVPVDDRPRPAKDARAYAEKLCALHPIGSPDECAQRILAGMESTGLDHVVMMVEGSGDAEATVENVRRLGAEVLPQAAGARAE